MNKTEKVKVTVTLPKDLLRRLEDYRKAQSTILSRSKAVTKLLNKALKTKGFTGSSENIS